VAQQTHRLDFDGDVVVKRYRQWEMGEPDREWRALNLLAEHARGLAPGSTPGQGSPDALLAHLPLPQGQGDRLRECRRLFGTFWLLMLLPGNPASTRNPPGTLDRQAERLLTLLAD
jgi:hypothetical protein